MPDENKSLYKKGMGRHRNLAAVRQPYEGVRREIIEIQRPELSLWDGTEESDKGRKRGLLIYNTVPIEALKTNADGMQGNMASPSLDWFRYAISDQELNAIPEVRQWLQDSEEIIYAVLRESNFYSTLNLVFKNAISLGDGCIFIEVNRDGDGIVCTTFHPRELFVAEGPDGKINIWHREFFMTGMNAAEKFGKDKLSLSLRNTLKENPQARHKFIHGIYRRDDPIFDGESGIPDRPWVSIYLEAGATEPEQKPVRMAGYFSFPAPFWRLEQISDSVYGWGISCSHLVSIYQLNAVTKTNRRAEQLAVAPPLLAPMGLKGRLSIRPNAKNWVTEPGQDVKEILRNINIPAGVEAQKDLENAIEGFYEVPFFLMLSRSEKPKTATEIIETAGERSVLSGPRIGRSRTDLFNPVHDRVFEIAMTNEWLPQPPDILLEMGDRIEVEYMGPLDQAQKRLFETRRSQRTLADVGPIAEAFPETLDNMDGDKTFRRMLRDGGWPEDEIRPEEQRDQIREAKQKALEAQQAMAAAAEAAKLPGEAPEPGSPLAEAMRTQ